MILNRHVAHVATGSLCLADFCSAHLASVLGFSGSSVMSEAAQILCCRPTIRPLSGLVMLSLFDVILGSCSCLDWRYILGFQLGRACNEFLEMPATQIETPKSTIRCVEKRPGRSLHFCFAASLGMEKRRTLRPFAPIRCTCQVKLRILNHGESW